MGILNSKNDKNFIDSFLVLKKAHEKKVLLSSIIENYYHKEITVEEFKTEDLGSIHIKT